MPALASTIEIDRDLLERLVESRLREAQVLYDGRCYTGSIYLAGYAVECCLKVAICRVLDCDGLLGTFLSHELEVLLLHSGLKRRMQRHAPEVYRSFANIQGVWVMSRDKSIRYRDPEQFGADGAKTFLNWVMGESCGVVPWLRRQA